MLTKNMLQLTGNVTKPAETRTIGETSVTKARLVHNETIRKADGTTVEDWQFLLPKAQEEESIPKAA